VPANGIHSSKPSTESVRQQKAFKKVVAEDWPREESEQKSVRKVLPKIGRRQWPKSEEFLKVVSKLCDVQQSGRMPFL
jgi:hypothetical protein